MASPSSAPASALDKVLDAGEVDVWAGLLCKLCVEVTLEVRVAATFVDVDREDDNEDELEPPLQKVMRRLTYASSKNTISLKPRVV